MPEKRGKTRIFKDSEALLAAWNTYKADCRQQTAPRTSFSAKAMAHITDEVPAPIIPTIKGFHTYYNMPMSTYYEYYVYEETGHYTDAVEQIKAEAEMEARRGFEQGYIPASLAPLWMFTYGYTTREAPKVDALEKTVETLAAAILGAATNAIGVKNAL